MAFINVFQWKMCRLVSWRVFGYGCWESEAVAICPAATLAADWHYVIGAQR